MFSSSQSNSIPLATAYICIATYIRSEFPLTRFACASEVVRPPLIDPAVVSGDATHGSARHCSSGLPAISGPGQKTSLPAISRVPTVHTDLSHRLTQGGFLGLPVLSPTLLPGGLDAASSLLSQHPAARKPYLDCNIFAREKCVRYCDRQQRCSRLFQVARKRPTDEMDRVARTDVAT